MRKTLVLTSSLVAAALTGCSPLVGSVYTDVKFPSYYQGAAEKGMGSKSGSGTVINILGVYAAGDASVQNAANTGGIKTIHTVDHHYWSILGVYQKWTTTVTGE